MSDWTLNGLPVLRASLHAPLQGRWTADVEVDTDDALTGPVDLMVGGVLWRAAVLRGGLGQGTWRARLVGGTGGLDLPVAARAWQGLQAARGLVVELLTEVGETLDAGSGDELTTTLPRWSRVDTIAHRALADLAGAVDARWRVTPEGAVWVGTETWPEIILPDGVQVETLDDDPRRGVSVCSVPGGWITPGRSLDGRRIGAVAYELTPERDRLTVWWVDG